MNNLRQAAQQAILLCQWIDKTPHQRGSINGMAAQVKHALEQALAEPEQEPVRLQCTTCGTVYADGVPPQVPEQKPQTTHWEGCEAVHPECRKPEQEPVAWMVYTEGGTSAYVTDNPNDLVGAYRALPLYTAPTPQPDTDCHLQGICQRSGYSIAPAPRKPLRDEEIDAVYIGCKHGSINEFARALERAHGITGGSK